MKATPPPEWGRYAMLFASLLLSIRTRRRGAVRHVSIFDVAAFQPEEDLWLHQ